METPAELQMEQSGRVVNNGADSRYSTMPPPALSDGMDVAAIPDELKSHSCWVLWQLETRDGKPNKVPYQPRQPSRRASSTDSAHWTTFAEALMALQGLHQPDLYGLGFVFHPELNGLVGVDLDKVIDPDTGEMADWAAPIVQALASYTELSPSGTGLHIIVRGTLPPGRRKKGNHTVGAVEMYASGRFFTMTGRHWSDTPRTVEERTPQLATLHRRVFGSDEQPPHKPTAKAKPDAAATDDAALLERIRQSRQGTEFARLYDRADLSGHNNDHSAADLALCNMLAFWTDKDPARMDRLFRQSALFRPKWDERRGELAYGALTIQRAISDCREGYNTKAGGTDSASVDHTGELGEELLLGELHALAERESSLIVADPTLRELAKRYNTTYTLVKAEFQRLHREAAEAAKAREKAQRQHQAQQAFVKQETTPEEVIKQLNRDHAVVPVQNRVMILSESYEPTLNRRMFNFISQSDLRLRYANRGVMIPKGDSFATVKWADYWLENEHRREYRGLTFYPGDTPDGYLNLWTGFAIEPDPDASCERLMEHVFEVLCNGDQDKFEYLWLWLAHLIQRPHELPETAIVLRGKQGTGKNTLVDCLGKIFGRHYVALNQTGQLCGRFSGHLMDALLVFANEAVWGGDKQGEGSLKAMITDRLLTIEAKGKDAFSFQNYRRIIAASNEHWAVPRGIDDRRFFCLDVSDKRKGDHAYFQALHSEIENGAAAALLYTLQSIDLTGWHPRSSMPHGHTDGEDMKLESLSTPLKFWHECLCLGYNVPDETDERGLPYPDSQRWHTEVNKTTLFKFYEAWCSRKRITHMANPQLFGAELKKACEIGTARPRPQDDGPRGRYYCFPDLETARKQFQEKINMPFDW